MNVDEAATAGAIAAEVVEAAVEDAVEAEQVAIETAEVIAAAAMETERGNRVEALERRVDECQTILQNLPTMLAAETSNLISQAANSMRADLMAEMTSQLSAVVAGLANPNHLSSTLPASEPVPVEVVEVTEAPEPTPEPTKSEEGPAKKSRHRFL